MINYELAKKLKDAGFPQPEEPTTGHYDTWVIRLHHGAAYILPQSRVMSPYIYRFSPGMSYPREAIFIPTLSELLEACGKEFLKLELLLPADTSAKEIHFKVMGKWVAWTHRKEEVFRNEAFAGHSPEEAVASLWLMLNQK